jgi:hypothetical protein
MSEPTTPTPEDAARAEVAALKPTRAPKGMSEQDIAAKVSAGLDRAQAIEVLTAQAAHDARLEEEAEKAAKKKK